MAARACPTPRASAACSSPTAPTSTPAIRCSPSSERLELAGELAVAREADRVARVEQRLELARELGQLDEDPGGGDPRAGIGGDVGGAVADAGRQREARR